MLSSKDDKDLMILKWGLQTVTINVLVLCTGNSARSVLGEALINRLGKGRFKAYSAGSKPTGRVNPAALKLLAAKGYDTSAYRSKSWDEFRDDQAPKMDIILTVCSNAAGETCPIWPMKEGERPVRQHIGFPDPADFGETEDQRDQAFETVYTAENQVFEALTALALEDMPKSEWSHALSAIDVPAITL